MPPPGSLTKRAFNREEIADALESQFGLSRDETRAYLKLLESRNLTVEEAAEALNIAHQDTVNLLERMVARGLIIRSAGSAPRFAPLHPRMTLTNIFKEYEQGVVKALRERRATVDRIVNLLTPIFEERKS